MSDELRDDCRQNTDREIWRGKSRAEFGDPDCFYADSLSVPVGDVEALSIHCGGTVITKPIREWHRLALAAPPAMSDELREAIERAIQDLSRTLGRAEIEMVRRDLRAALDAPLVEGDCPDCDKLISERDEMEERVNSIAEALGLTEEEMQWSNLNDVGERCVEKAEQLSALSTRVAKHFEAIKKLHIYEGDLISREAVIALLESAIGSTPHSRVEELADALRSVNDLQHRMAIELQNIPQEPRIEYWTRKMEDVICKALESE